MKQLLDDATDDFGTKQGLQNSYKWLLTVVCVETGVSVFYFLFNLFGRHNLWIYDWAEGVSILILIARLTIFIIAAVKVHTTTARVLLICTASYYLLRFVLDWFDLLK